MTDHYETAIMIAFTAACAVVGYYLMFVWLPTCLPTMSCLR